MAKIDFQDKHVTISLFPSQEKGIPKIEAVSSGLDPTTWVAQHKNKIDELLLTYGGILLRNFNIVAVSEFNRFSNSMDPNLLDYTYRSTPRTKLGGKIYTATEYPADRHIPWHNENSYCDKWPNHILFFCVIPPSIEGGETPLADSRKVYQALDKKLIKKFEEKKVCYVRNYYKGIDLSWQEVFQTDDKKEVEKFCSDHHISFNWSENDPTLTTKQTCQSTLVHPKTGEKVWFNQAHLFHISSLDPSNQKLLREELGIKNLTRNAYFGDESEISEPELDQIRAAYKQEEIVFKWQKGDIMVLDNVLMTHARRPFKGDRKIVVAMY